MVMLVNKSAACISATTPHKWGKANEFGVRQIKEKGRTINFVPATLTKIGDSTFTELKKIPLIQRSLDNKVLVLGKEANKVASEAEVLIAEAEQADAEVRADTAAEQADELKVDTSQDAAAIAEDAAAKDEDLLA